MNLDPFERWVLGIVCAILLAWMFSSGRCQIQISTTTKPSLKTSVTSGDL